MNKAFYVISGCSGGGKSTLVAELAARGHQTVPEPGRMVVREQLARGGDALPWANAAAFIRRVLELAVEQYEQAPSDGIVFFDRSIVDAVGGILRGGGELPARYREVLRTHRYAPTVFLAPPWKAIYRSDAERRHSFADGVAEFEALAAEYRALGYEVVLLPRAAVSARADFVVETTSSRRAV